MSLEKHLIMGLALTYKFVRPDDPLDEIIGGHLYDLPYLFLSDGNGDFKSCMRIYLLNINPEGYYKADKTFENHAITTCSKYRVSRVRT